MNDWLNTPVPPDATRRVHSGVMKRIQRHRQERRAAGILTVLAVLAFAFWPAPAPLETLAFSLPPPPSAPVWVPPPVPKKVRVLMAKATSRPAERITIYTDDPDVVIVLVADGGEE